jgi:hypothetical protein
MDFKVIVSLRLIKHYVVNVRGVVKWQLSAYLACQIYDVYGRIKYKIIKHKSQGVKEHIFIVTSSLFWGSNLSFQQG